MRFTVTATACLISLWATQGGCQPPQPSQSLPASTSEASSQASPAPSSSAAPEDAPKQAAANESEVELLIADLAKLDQTVKGQAGKVVVVDIWSTSCAPCLREFPHLVELSQRYRDKVACVSFNVDYIGLKSKPPENYRPAVEEFLKKQRATLTNLLSAATDEAVLTKFKLESIPAILIYGADGSLLHTLTDVNTGEDGLTYAGDVIPKVEELLAAGK